MRSSCSCARVDDRADFALRPKVKPVRTMIKIALPKDIASAQAIVSIEWPEISDYLSDMAFFCLDTMYPVAEIFAPKLVELGHRAVPAVRGVIEQFIEGKNGWELYCLLNDIVSKWEVEVIGELSDDLTRITELDLPTDEQDCRLKAFELLERISAGLPPQ